MVQWKRVKSATEWGFFYGIVTWLFATGITNKFSSAGVWGIILSRTLMGFIIGVIKWKFPWWARGLIVGVVVNLVFEAIAKIPMEFIRRFCFGWTSGFWLMLITGMLFGLLIELPIRPKIQAKHK